ncbi:MAG TPA: RNA-binding protein [Ignavibacteria bacterium]|jgi:RNA recognition motif-containing protein
MNIYVGNLATDVSEAELREVFMPYSPSTVSIIKDKFTGESRGFGFVEIKSKDSALKAIVELTGKEIKGKCIITNEAKPRENNRNRSGFGNRSFRRY